MSLSANSPVTNLAVTALVLALVVFLPLIDRKVCAKLGLDVRHGLSSNPKAASLLRVRSVILYGIFALYICANAYLVFFSRSATAEYQVHVAPLEDLATAVTTDAGLMDILQTLFTQGLPAAVSMIHVVKAQDIAQVYMNVALYVPMGYLLPYVFEWFRARPRTRPFIAGVIISFATENLQLIFKRGFYDMDDLISNSLGALIGQMLFLSLAYVVTHPDWRRELKKYRRWRKNAKKRTLYPFMRRICSARATIRATDECAVWDFYVDQLGFRVLSQIVREDEQGTSFLLQLGGVQIEVLCSNLEEELAPQALTFQVRNLDCVRRRLTERGVSLGADELDAYTGRRKLTFEGPDHVAISLIE